MYFKTMIITMYLLYLTQPDRNSRECCYFSTMHVNVKGILMAS